MGKKVATHNFARGHYTIGKSMVDFVLYLTKELSDSCTRLQSLLVCTAFGGGTGSGLGCWLRGRSLNDTVLCVQSTLERTGVAVMIDNEALDIELNRLLAQVFSSPTVFLSYDDVLNVVVIEFLAKLVPYRRIYILRCSYAPSSRRRRPTLYSCR